MSKITKKDIKEHVELYEEMVRDRELNIKVIRGEIGMLIKTISLLKTLEEK